MLRHFSGRLGITQKNLRDEIWKRIIRKRNLKSFERRKIKKNKEIADGSVKEFVRWTSIKGTLLNRHSLRHCEEILWRDNVKRHPKETEEKPWRPLGWCERQCELYIMKAMRPPQQVPLYFMSRSINRSNGSYTRARQTVDDRKAPVTVDSTVEKC